MVRRRRDEGDPGVGVADLRDVRGDLVAGELASLSRLGALGHFNLQIVRVDEVFGRDAEAPGGDLLDGRSHGVAVREQSITRWILAALAGVGFAADPVHREGERRVSLARYG